MRHQFYSNLLKIVFLSFTSHTVCQKILNTYYEKDVRSQMYHIVRRREVNHNVIGKSPLSYRDTHFRRKGSTQLHSDQLTCSKSL